LLSLTNQKKIGIKTKKFDNFNEHCYQFFPSAQAASHWAETFAKCSFLFAFKEGQDFNYMNTLSILMIKF